MFLLNSIFSSVVQDDTVDLPIFDVDLPALSAAGTAQRIRRPLVSVAEMGVCHRHDGRRSPPGRLGRIGKVAGIFQRLQRAANRHELDVPAPDSSQTRQTSRHSQPGAEGHHLVRPHPISTPNQSAVTQQRRRKPKTHKIPNVLITKTFTVVVSLATPSSLYTLTHTHVSS